jgi:hypothetical protein
MDNKISKLYNINDDIPRSYGTYQTVEGSLSIINSSQGSDLKILERQKCRSKALKAKKTTGF